MSRSAAAVLPHRPLPQCHRAAVRGAGPAAELLLFIYRLCLLRPPPSFRALPGPRPSHPHAGLSFPGPCAPRPRAGSQIACRGAGCRATFPLPPTGPQFPDSEGAPSQAAPGGQGWSSRRGLAEGARVCVSHKSLWWVGRVSCAGGVTGGGEE